MYCWEVADKFHSLLSCRSFSFLSFYFPFLSFSQLEILIGYSLLFDRFFFLRWFLPTLFCLNIYIFCFIFLNLVESFFLSIIFRLFVIRLFCCWPWDCFLLSQVYVQHNRKKKIENESCHFRNDKERFVFEGLFLNLFCSRFSLLYFCFCIFCWRRRSVNLWCLFVAVDDSIWRRFGNFATHWNRRCMIEVIWILEIS